MKIKAIILDWAGTTVDYGCFAPVAAFQEAFEQYGLHPTCDEIRKPMGMLKIDHIRTMLEMTTLHQEFIDVYHRNYNHDDIDKIYNIFEKVLMDGIMQHTQLKAHVLETVQWLRKQGIKIGSTTGYTDFMMEPVLKSAKAQGYQPDCWYSPDATKGFGRPYPYMIFKNMMTLEVLNVQSVIKVGDTISDILEGKNAGIYSVGVIEGSSLLGYSEKEYLSLDDATKENAIAKAQHIYFENGADAIIMNLAELPALIHQLETNHNAVTLD